MVLVVTRGDLLVRSFVLVLIAAIVLPQNRGYRSSSRYAYACVRLRTAHPPPSSPLSPSLVVPRSRSIRLPLYLIIHTLRTIRFLQELPQGANNTRASSPTLPDGYDLDLGSYPPVVSFPSFAADGGRLRNLGYTTWEGCMVRRCRGWIESSTSRTRAVVTVPCLQAVHSASQGVAQGRSCMLSLTLCEFLNCMN